MHIEVEMPEVAVERRGILMRNLTDTVANILGLPQAVRDSITVCLRFCGRSQMGRAGVLLHGAAPGLYHIDAYLTPLSPAVRQALTEHLTNALCDSIELPRAWMDQVFVRLHELPEENFACGGRPMIHLARA
jgi:hypothetical protein